MTDEETGTSWLDADAGPVVRPYAVTGGRVQTTIGGLDLIAFIVAGPEAARGDAPLQPEHRAIIAATDEPTSVAELASRLDLAVGVVRVLLDDLIQQGLVTLSRPGSSNNRPDQYVLKAVIDGLRAL